MPRRHDRDAAGDAAALTAKAQLREEVWSALAASKAARFPGAAGRIPNFVGAEAAAERLRGVAVWRDARNVKANPDSPQWPVRQRAVEDGKTLIMAVPRLAEAKPFFLLDPDRITGSPREATSIKGASRSGVPVDVSELEPVDLVVAGSVAVGEDGARLGKGGGFSDLELAVAAQAGLVGPETVVVTTVHEVQVRPAGEIPTTPHDVHVDLVVTPERVLDCARPSGYETPRLRWDELTDEKIAAIPLLGRLRVAQKE
jgi:5-formyltetrahydrofolate cyclo-ligase